MTVAESIAEFLVSKGCTHAFGIVGGANLALFEAMARRMTVVSTHHEQAAAIAAAYYYRTCGRIAPCLVTAGGGVMNALTGVREAHMDSIPLLVLSGNELSKMFQNVHMRSVGFQGFNVPNTVTSFVKWAVQIKDAPLRNLLEHTMYHVENAYRVALQPRQGACWVDIPQDYANASIQMV